MSTNFTKQQIETAKAILFDPTYSNSCAVDSTVIVILNKLKNLYYTDCTVSAQDFIEACMDYLQECVDTRVVQDMELLLLLGGQESVDNLCTDRELSVKAFQPMVGCSRYVFQVVCVEDGVNTRDVVVAKDYFAEMLGVTHKLQQDASDYILTQLIGFQDTYILKATAMDTLVKKTSEYLCYLGNQSFLRKRLLAGSEVFLVLNFLCPTDNAKEVYELILNNKFESTSFNVIYDEEQKKFIYNF